MDRFLDRYFLSGLTILWINFRPLLLMGHFGPFPRMGFMGLFMIYIPVGRICIIMLFYDLYSHLGIFIILLIVWFILLIGKFVTFCSSYNLYSHLENLYHFVCCMIYIPAWRICIILLVVWFIFVLGEFVSFCSSYDLYSHLGSLYHFACHMIYILTWRICMIFF